MTLTTRYIGFCPVCERRIKLADGRLVHHGYERPGTGYIVGDCYGVKKPPHETSPETAQGFLDDIILPQLIATERRLAYYRNDPPTLPFHKQDERGRWLYAENGMPVLEDRRREDVPDYDWKYRLRIIIANTENRLRGLEQEADRLRGLIDTWKREPLETVEEEVERTAGVRRARALAAQEKRDRALADAVLRFRARLDSAVKNRSPGPILDIFESHKLRELSRYTISHDEGLDLLERPDIWRAFGLLTDEGYVQAKRESPAWQRLVDMKYGRRPGDPVPEWPEALGGPTKRKIR